MRRADSLRTWQDLRAGHHPEVPGTTIDETHRTSAANLEPSQSAVGSPLAEAQRLDGWGLNILPAPVKEKSPRVEWKRWTTERASRMVPSWFRASGESNYWIACGAVSGVYVLDIDNPAAERWWRDVAKLGDLMDRTVCARTAKGYHYYFAMPEGQDWRGWAFHDQGLEFDVRGTGGGVIAPPSIHESGVVYEWVRSPDDAPMVEAPEWMRSRDALQAHLGAKVTPERSSTGGSRTLAELLADPPQREGGRDNWLIAVCGHYQRLARTQHGDDQTWYERQCWDAARLIRPPLSDDEVTKKIESAQRMDRENHPQREADEKGEKKSAATLLVELAQSSYRFGCTDDGSVFALRPGSHVVRTLTGDKRSLRAELSRAFFRTFGKAPAQQALADAQGVIEGMAQERNPETVSLRVAQTADAIWIDMGDQDERVVKITGGSWQVQETCPVLFSRTALTGALPTPTRGVPLDRLWGHLNVSERDRPMVLAWLVQALLQPGLPHPVLTLFGEQGTAKSTLTRRLVSLIDPSPVPVRKPPKDGEAWISAAQGSYVVGLDNLSSIPDWFSDSLCRAATGDGDIRRTLYKDKQLTVFAFRRAVLLNGIDVGALRGDLASRAVLVHLDRLATTRAEQAMEAEWQADYPGLVGALLTFAAQVAEVLPGVTVERPPRMADYAHVLAAVDQVLGTTGATRYGEQEETLAEDAITANPFLAALADRGKPFRGTGGELLALLEPRLDHWRKPQGWPATPRYVTTLLMRNAPALRQAGWRVETDEDRHQKVTVWDLTPPSEDSDELF